MPRLFTGLEVPAHLAEELASLRGGVSGARWMDAQDFHITLSFIGDVDGRTAHELTQELGSVAVRPFPVSLEGLGAFGGAKPRAIVARFALNEGLKELHDEQERALRRVGIEPERRKYAPHVTLARLKGVSPHAVADFITSRSPDPVTFMATRFVLYSARDSVGGGPYIIEAAYPLD